MKKIINKVWVRLFIAFCMFNVATYLIIAPEIIFCSEVIIVGIWLFCIALLVLIGAILDGMLSRYKNKIKKDLRS